MFKKEVPRFFVCNSNALNHTLFYTYATLSNTMPLQDIRCACSTLDGRNKNAHHI